MYYHYVLGNFVEQDQQRKFTEKLKWRELKVKKRQRSEDIIDVNSSFIDYLSKQL